MRTSNRGFSSLETFVIFSLTFLMVAAVLSSLITTHLSARDAARLADMSKVQAALQGYEKDHGYFPKEADSANGNIATNENFQKLLRSYLSSPPRDPAGEGDSVFYFYYDGSAQCGGEKKAVLFARQMDKKVNSNYQQFLSQTCGGILDGEGRGGGVESFNILLGKSGG